MRIPGFALVDVKMWSIDRVAAESKALTCHGVADTDQTTIFSPKSHRRWFLCCRCQALGCEGVWTASHHLSFPTGGAVQDRAAVLVWTSWSELALQETLPRAKPASLLPSWPGCQLACQAVCRAPASMEKGVACRFFNIKVCHWIKSHGGFKCLVFTLRSGLEGAKRKF